MLSLIETLIIVLFLFICGMFVATYFVYDYSDDVSRKRFLLFISDTEDIKIRLELLRNEMMSHKIETIKLKDSLDECGRDFPNFNSIINELEFNINSANTVIDELNFLIEEGRKKYKSSKSRDNILTELSHIRYRVYNKFSSINLR